MIIKGALFGLLAFVIVFAVFIGRAFRNSMVDTRTIQTLTIYNIFFWMGLVGFVFAGCAIAGYWPSKG